MKTYRVFMKDGYAGLYNGETEQEARLAAIDWARKSVEGAAMSPRDKNRATTVDYAEQVGGGEECPQVRVLQVCGRTCPASGSRGRSFSWSPESAGA